MQGYCRLTSCGPQLPLMLRRSGKIFNPYAADCRGRKFNFEEIELTEKCRASCSVIDNPGQFMSLSKKKNQRWIFPVMQKKQRKPCFPVRASSAREGKHKIIICVAYLIPYIFGFGNMANCRSGTSMCPGAEEGSRQLKRRKLAARLTTDNWWLITSNCKRYFTPFFSASFH